MSFCADRGYDSDANSECLYGAGIRQRTPQPGVRTNLCKPHRRRAAEEFDADMYWRRGVMGGLFGGPESKNHRLPSRCRRGDAREGRGPATATGWNPVVPDRPECAGETGIGWIGAVRGAAAA